jgi:hypothetical protein
MMILSSSLLLLLAAIPVSSRLNGDISHRRLFEEGPPSLRVSGGSQEDVYCSCVAHNCYFNPSIYESTKLKTVFDVLDRSSAYSVMCGDDNTLGCLQVNHTSSALFGNYTDMAMGYVGHASAECACPDRSSLYTAIVNRDVVRGAKIISGLPFQSSQGSDGDFGIVVHSLHSLTTTPQTELMQIGTKDQSISTDTTSLLVNYPGIGYCVDSSLEVELLSAIRPVSNWRFPNSKTTASIQIPKTTTDADEYAGRLVVAACCQAGQSGHNPSECNKRPRVKMGDAKKRLILGTAVKKEEDDDFDFGSLIASLNITNPCVLVKSKEDEFCIGKGTDDELCVTGRHNTNNRAVNSFQLVCDPQFITAEAEQMELGCPLSYMTVYNEFVAEHGHLTKGYQMRSPQGYEKGIVQSLGCIKGDLKGSRFYLQGCSDIDIKDDALHMHITNNDGSAAGLPAERHVPDTIAFDDGGSGTRSGSNNNNEYDILTHTHKNSPSLVKPDVLLDDKPEGDSKGSGSRKVMVRSVLAAVVATSFLQLF